jgi:hypothetical protein
MARAVCCTMRSPGGQCQAPGLGCWWLRQCASPSWALSLRRPGSYKAQCSHAAASWRPDGASGQQDRGWYPDRTEELGTPAGRSLKPRACGASAARSSCR